MDSDAEQRKRVSGDGGRDGVTRHMEGVAVARQPFSRFYLEPSERR